MYAATRRLIFGTHAEAEVQAKREIEDLSEFVKDTMTNGISSDGTIQITVEDLEPKHLTTNISDAEALLKDYHNDPAGLARELDKVIVAAFNQGRLEQLHSLVTFKFTEQKP